jgi:RHS repeat-associated protein
MTQHEYDVAGHRVATRVFSPAPISALRSETRWSYNLRGEQTAEIRAVLDEDGVEVGSVARSFLTDPAGRQVATIDEEGQEWRTVRDALGRSVAEMDPLGHASIISRDANGSPSSIADPLDNIVDYYYDVRGLRIRTVDQQMYEFGQTYDERGLPTSQTCEPTEPTDPLIVDTTAYNAFGEVSSTTAASGVGGTVESTVAYTRDAIGQVTAVAAAQDSGGTQVHAVSYDYDGAGNVVTETDTDSTHAEYFYDAAGNLRLEVKRDGSIVARLRDPLGQVTDVYTFPDATDPATLSTDAAVQTGTLRQHFVYDDLGRLVSATDYNDTGTGDDHTVNFVYSSLGEPIQEEHVFANGAASYTLTVGYDKRSAPVSLSYPSGAIATITRDERGLPVAFDYDPGAGTAITVAMCGYDAAGRLSDAAFGNGLAMARDFDARSLELGRTYADGANIVLNVTTGTVASTYDSRGNPLGETVAGAIAASAQTARTFAYDERDRLAAQDGAGSEDDASWTLDKLGNWTSVTEAGVTENRTVSLDNEYTVIDAGAVTNDANGNLTVHAGLTFSYDWANRLVEVLDGTVALASYTYDALGRRVSRTTGGTTTRYIHSGSQVIEEYEDSGPGFSLARRYVLGPGLDQPILMDDAGATTDGPYYYLRNRQGSVLALTDVDGDVVESYTYSAYGSMRLFDNTGTEITTSVSLLGNPYGYTGRRFDTEAGLLYYRNRYYSPELGRFLTRDPAGHVDGMNLYAYVRGNPLAYIDPWGLQAMGSSDGWTPAPLEGYYPPESLFSTPATTYQQQYLAAHADPDPQQSVSFWEQAKMGMGTAWEAAKAAPGYAYDYGSSAYCAWANANTLGAVQWTAEKLSGNDADLYYRYRASDAERSGAVFGTKLALLQTAVEGVVGTTMAVMGKGTTVVGVLMNVVPGVGNAASLPTVVAGASATTAGLAIDAHAGLVGTKAYDQLQQLNAMTGSGSSGGSAGSAPKNSLPSNEGQMKHIFREAEGHIADTPTNRQLLLDVADDTATTLGTDRFGNTWSARTLEDGSQVWVQTRNGVVQNGGINAVPKQFNPKTGLSGGGG